MTFPIDIDSNTSFSTFLFTSIFTRGIKIIISLFIVFTDFSCHKKQGKNYQFLGTQGMQDLLFLIRLGTDGIKYALL